MRGRAGLQLLRCLGLVSGLFCMLAGCGGNSGSTDQSSAGARVGQLSLQLRFAAQPVSAALNEGLASAQGRQVQPGDPGFLARLTVRLQAQGSDPVSVLDLPLSPSEQETVTREVTVPATISAPFQVLVSAFTTQGIEAYRGNDLVMPGEASALVTLVRAALVPVPATPANLQQTTFLFPDGAAVGLPSGPFILATGTFQGNVGDFALLAQGFIATGQVVIASCTFTVMTSAFPPGQGPQVGAQIIIDPCQVDAIDNRLIATNVNLSATPIISSPPVPVPPGSGVITPGMPPSLVLKENTSATLQIDASLNNNRPGTVTFAITTPPAHGTATITNTGVLTYTPVANFSGTDRLVVTVVVSFSDNQSPPLLLGTIPVSITVQEVNTAPRADAGPDQTVTVGSTVTLRGNGSSDVDGDLLSFAWSLISLPAGSQAALSDPTSVAPTFVVDRPGMYVGQLLVNDGRENSPPDFSTISTINSAPVANAGAAQTVAVGTTVILQGNKSSDVDGDTLTFTWSLLSQPVDSQARLSNPTSVNPVFVVDRPGAYVAQLTVSDGQFPSIPATVTISTANSAPVANAGPDQTVALGTTVRLDGSGSTDVDGDRLTLAWSFVSLPPGSTSTLSSPTAVTPTFVLHLSGTYVVQLIANDGQLSSAPATVTITTGNSAPVANAGHAQTVAPGTVVRLDGSGSHDVNNDPLAFTWSLSTIPAGSTAMLLNPSAVNPTFPVDLPGIYIAQLIVNDGQLNSVPDTVTISTLNAVPVAIAGPDQTLALGGTAALDGRNSFDADNDPLLFFWSLTVVPPNSTARLDNPAAATPAFVADQRGDYVAQLIVFDSRTSSEPDTVLLTVPPGITLLSLPTTLNVGPGQIVSMPITIAPTPAPPGGVVVTLSSSDPSVQILTPTVTIPAGKISANGQVQGIGAGTATISGSAPGFTIDNTTVTTGGNLNIVQTQVDMDPSFPGLITVQLETASGAFPAPAAGSTVNLTAANPGCVTVPASVTIPAGLVNSNVTLQYGGAAPLPCTTTVTTNAANFQSDSVTVNVNPPPGIMLSNLPFTVSLPATVGAGLQQTFFTVRLGTRNHGGSTVRVTSSDPTITLVSPDPSTPGSAFVDIFIANGNTDGSYTIQGVEGASGLVTLTAAAPGFTNGTGMVTVVQPALQLNGLQFFATTFTVDTPFQVLIGVPDPNHNFVTQPQMVRAGGTPLTVTLTNSNGTVGQLVTTASTGQTATVPIAVGQSTSPSIVAQGGVAFDSLNVGSTTVSAAIPGFIATGAAMPLVTVATPSISLFTPFVNVGAGLQTGFFTVRLNGANHGGVTLHLVSSNPALVLLSPDASTPGSASIDLPIANGATDAMYFVQGVEGTSGTVTLTASAPGFTDGTGTVNVLQSALQISGLPTNTTTAAADSPFQVAVGLPDAGRTFLTQIQAVRAGGIPLTATLTNSNGTVGQLVTTASTGQTVTVPIAAGQTSSPSTVALGGVAFKPLVPGSTAINATIPGFISTAAATVTLTDATPGITLFNLPTTIGAGLQNGSFTIRLGATNHGGVTLRLASGDPALVLLSPDASTPGSASLDLPIANGATDAVYFIQGVEGASGTVTLTASAPGFTNGTGTVTVVAPALQLDGLLANTTTLTVNSPFQIAVGIPDVGRNFLTQRQAVRAGGTPLTATLTNSNSTVGQLVTTASTGQTVTVPIAVGQLRSPFSVAQGGVAFDPFTTGTTTVSATIPGFIPTVAATVTLTDATPGITLFGLPTTVGAGLQAGAFTVNLGASNHGGVILRLASSNPAVALVSPAFQTPGSAFIDLTIADGTVNANFFVQGLEGARGSVAVIASASGFIDGSGIVTVVQPALAINGLLSSLTMAAPDDPFTVSVGVPASNSTGLSNIQAVRAGGTPLTVTLTNSTSAAGQLVTTAATGQSVTLSIAVGQASSSFSVATGGVAFDALAPGATTVQATIPGLFATSDATRRVIVTP